MRHVLIHSLVVLTLSASATVARAQTYDLSWHSIDNGGVLSASGGIWQLGASIGQPDAGPSADGMTGGLWTLVGGFQVAAAIGGDVRHGDINCDGYVDFFDIDPFLLVLVSPTQYAVTFPNCDMSSADCNQDSNIDFFDIDPFVYCLLEGCPG